MKNINNHNFFISSIILILFIIHSNAQPECHVNRFPQVLPMQFGQETSINLQQYIWGTNITYTVQPNDFHSNIQPQYTCRRIWSHRLGKIIQTKNYQHTTVNNKTQLFIAMLGGSSYYNDLYMIYYGIKATTIENNNTEKQQSIQKQDDKLGFDYSYSNNINEDSQVLVLQVPRYELKNCMRFVVESNGTHAEFIIDCFSPSSRLNKIMATTVVSLNQPQPINPKWVMLQSPIYLPQQLIPILNVTTSISVIQQTTKMRYLVRMIMTEYADYIEVWRWTKEGKQIIGVYDSLYFMEQGAFATGDVDLRKMQCISNTILIMDLINGLHILQLTPTGTLLYLTTLPDMSTFTTFHYDPRQQLLFMAKRGIIQQFQIKIFSPTNIRANRIQRYHLYGFEQINQIVVQSRYLYVSTGLYLHVIHLTNIPSNDQEYDGSYNVYRELYNQMIVALEVGFVKVDAAQANVEISLCETHPPFLHLKAPQFNNHFTVNAVSVLNGISTTCTLKITTQAVQADDDRVYVNGYQSQNETIYSNRPGRTVMDLDKYAIGKNLQYEITLYNHQIQFEYKIRKVNNQSCQIKLQAVNNQQYLIAKTAASNVTRTFSVGNWLIVEHPEDRIKEYYKCDRYSIIQCNFIQISITTAAYAQSAYQLLQQQRTKKQSILEAVLFQQNNQTTIEVVLVSRNQPKSQQSQSKSQQQQQQQQQKDQQPLYLVKTLCSIRFPVGEQYKVGEIKLRQDKLYVVLPYLKQIRVYAALLSFQPNQQCHQFGTLNLSSFRQHINTFYFSPRHIDFDKHQLFKPYIVPSFTLFSSSSTYIQSISSQSVQTMFITQFNQVLVVRLVISAGVISRVELLKEVTLDRTNQANDIQVIVTLPNILAVDKMQRTIAQYYVSHVFDRVFIRSYPFWINNNIVDGSIRLIDANTFAVMAQPDQEKNNYAQVYQIDSIVSSFKQYARFAVDGAFHVMNFNDDDQYEFVTARLKQTATVLQLVCNSTTVTLSPYAEIEIDKPNKDDEPSREQFFLTSYTLQDSRREVVTLQVASDSSDIQKGTQYPYTTYTLRIQEDQNEAYFQIDDLKWFSGNIWSHRYVCNDCKTGRIKFEDKISLKEKIQLQAFNNPNDFYVTKIDSQQETYEFQTIEGYLLTKMTPQTQNNTWLNSVQDQLKERLLGDISYDAFGDQNKQNVTYTFSQSLILSSNIENQPKCIKASPQDHDLYFVSMCSDYEFLDDSALIQLRLYSTTGFKPFIIHQYLIEVGDLTDSLNLKASTKSQTQLIVMSSSLQQQQAGNYDIVFVRFEDNIWIFLIVNGKFQLIYTVDKVDFGPDDHLCWIEVIKRKTNLDRYGESSQGNELNKTITQYGVIASMCESGLYHIVFTVDPPKSKTSDMLKAQKQPLPSFHLLTQQQIDMQTELQKSRIQLPQHSYFLQTIPKPIQDESDQFQLHMIISNFNSFIWKVSLLKGTLIISGMQLIGIIRRYNQYSPIQVTSNDDRYFSVLYRSVQNANVSEFLALYDTKYFVINEEKEIKQYEMFSVYRTNDSPINSNKSEVFQIGTSLFILRQNQIKIFQVDNIIKMRVQKKMPKQVVDSCKESSHISDQGTIQNCKSDNSDKANNMLSLTHEPQDYSKLPTQLDQTNDQYLTLYSQSIVIFVQTPTQVNSATIKLYSYDYFELSGWIIALIVLGAVLVLGLSYYGLSGLWRYYQKQRKLIKLETQLDEASSSERGSHDRDRRYSRDFDGQQIQQTYQRPQQGRQSQITTEEGALSKSLLQKYRQFQPVQQPAQQNKQDQQHQQTRNEEEVQKQTGLEQQ